VIVSFAIRNCAMHATPNCKSDKRGRSTDHQYIEIPDKTSSTKEEDKKHDGIEEMLRDFMQRRVLEAVYEEEEERSWESPRFSDDSIVSQKSTTINTIRTFACANSK
jgi:sodium-dependent phosphate transporter